MRIVREPALPKMVQKKVEKERKNLIEVPQQDIRCWDLVRRRRKYRVIRVFQRAHSA